MSDTLKELAERVERGETGREIDAAVASLLFVGARGSRLVDKLTTLVAYKGDVLVSVGGRPSSRYPAPPISTDRGLTASVIQERLPGWWFSSGHCYLTCHASIGPDHNDPEHSERLHKDFPPEAREEWDSGFHADLVQPSTEAAALLCCLLRALRIIEGPDE